MPRHTNAEPRLTRFSYTFSWIVSLHPLGQLEHQGAVLGRLGPVGRRLDRLAELDPPLGRQRNGAERAEPGEGGRQREVRRAEHAGQGGGLADLRVDLLAADHGHRHDRRAGAQRDLDEPAAAEALQPVAIAEGLARALHALGEHRHQLVLLQQAHRVVRRCDHTAHLAHEERHVGQVERPVEHQEARVARKRVLAEDRDAHHRRVPGHDAGVVGREQGATVRGHVLEAAHLDPPPAVVHELEEREDASRRTPRRSPTRPRCSRPRAVAPPRQTVSRASRGRARAPRARAAGRSVPASRASRSPRRKATARRHSERARLRLGLTRAAARGAPAGASLVGPGLH